MKKNYIPLAIAVVLIIGAIVYIKIQFPGDRTGANQDALVLDAPKSVTPTFEEKSSRYERAKEITTPDGFINTELITIDELIGKKIVLVDFWTYSCINCQRTTPYLNAWYEKYQDQGLEIIGVHTPEFEFEKKYENVQQAVIEEEIKYPVVLDNDYSTWHAYNNNYWPRKYLIDIDGFIIYDHIGEGGYEETEQQIQAALAERMDVLGMQGTIDSEIVEIDNAETSVAQSPEIYFGALRNELLGNGQSNQEGIQSLSTPDAFSADTFYLDGEWDFSKEFAQNMSSDAKIIFRYNAQNVFMVASAEEEIGMTVLVDGEPVSLRAGDDVNEKGNVVVKDDRLYTIIRDPVGPGEHTLELIIDEPGLMAFTFTFG